MTYQVVVAAGTKNVAVKVEAGDAYTAREIAKWLVDHAQHLQAHGVTAAPSAPGTRPPALRT